MNEAQEFNFQSAIDDIFKPMFPGLDLKLIEQVLRSNNGMIDQTIDDLLAINCTLDDPEDSGSFVNSIQQLERYQGSHEPIIPQHTLQEIQYNSNLEFKLHVAPGEKLTYTVMGDKKITVTSDMLKKISNMDEDSSDLFEVLDDCDCKISVLASGGFGTAVRCNYSNVGDIVMKCIEIESENAVHAEIEEKLKQNYNSFENELKCAIDLIKDRGNINIVQCFLPVLVYHNNFGFTLQEYGGTSLEALYFNKKVDGQDKKMNDKDIDKAIHDVAIALNYLHSIDDKKRKYTIHKDIRTANIVVDKEGPDGVYKLIDFGISCKTTDINSRITSRSIEEGHHFWKSPESCYHTLRKQEDYGIIGLAERKKPGRKSDIWSFGIAILEMKSFPKRPGFVNFCEIRCVHSGLFMQGMLGVAPGCVRICNDMYEVQIINQIEKLWRSRCNGQNVQKDIILNCLEQDEDERCSAQDILDKYE